LPSSDCATSEGAPSPWGEKQTEDKSNLGRTVDPLSNILKPVLLKPGDSLLETNCDRFIWNLVISEHFKKSMQNRVNNTIEKLEVYKALGELLEGNIPEAADLEGRVLSCSIYSCQFVTSIIFFNSVIIFPVLLLFF
jgi:hypothetical protein